ncbi:MAG: SDR family NAD(P)-dependent oxidoreductase [Lachnospiraceae bacterium]|nr:SDR family NAD(P)-dependent oxidoreductase [Lachnospiraceae bacterium]
MNIAIVTGASSGMGREFAIQLSPILHKTDEIWLVARRKDSLEELVINIEELLRESVAKSGKGPRVRAIPVDITDDVQLSHFAELLMIQNAGISVLINCAGVGTYGAFENLSRDETAQMVRLNVLALTQITKFCLPYMRRGSKIIQVASGAAFLPQRDFAVYAASKAYVYYFGKALGKELKNKGINVTVVCPGPVDTPFLSHAYGRYGQISLIKKLTMAEPENVVRKALKDCKKKKTVSIYGIPMKLLYRLTRGLIG